jgi:hypothetical protein
MNVLQQDKLGGEVFLSVLDHISQIPKFYIVETFKGSEQVLK